MHFIRNIIIFVLLTGISFSTTYNTPIIDGTIGADWDSDENMGLRDPSGPEEFYHYITWDANYLYIGYIDIDWPNNSNDHLVAHFDFLSGGSTEGINGEALGMTADFAFQMDRPGSSGVLTFHATRTQGQGTWSSTTQTWPSADIAFNDTNDHTEMRISWSTLTQGESSEPTPFVYYTAIEDNSYNPDYIWPDPPAACPGDFESGFFEAGPVFTGVAPNAGPPTGMEVVCNPQDQALPVELSLFAVENTIGGVEVHWRTESEIENLGFLVERKSETSDWKEIASYKTDFNLIGQGTTSAPSEYKLIDKLVEAGNTYEYRLADISYDGVVTYHSTRKITVEKNPQSSIIKKFTVMPAYPNPFNPSTTIQYGLDTDSKVAISIYDISGKLVNTILNTEQLQGWHSVKWDGLDNKNDPVPAGIYISRITSNNNTKTSKLMLLK